MPATGQNETFPCRLVGLAHDTIVVRSVCASAISGNSGVGEGRYMIGFDGVGNGFFDERPCWSDLSELPLCDGEARSH